MATRSTELARKLAKNQFWIRKMRTGFKVYDRDRDNIISIKDFIATAKRFGEKDPERADEIMETMTSLYTITAGGNRDAKLTVQEWIDTRVSFVAQPNAQQLFRDYSHVKFNMIDRDRSSLISPEEFRDYFECVGIDTKHAAASFKALDANGDGVISKDEFLDAAVECHFGTDEDHPSKLFYGPLAD